MRLRFCLGLLCASFGHSALAQNYQVKNGQSAQRADTLLSLMAFSVVPDLTTSSLSIGASNGNASVDTDLRISQLAGGFTYSDTLPLYIEGGISYSKYKPQITVSNGVDTQPISLDWQASSANGGIGWDFPLNKHFVLRPIFNFALGRVSSQMSSSAQTLSYTSSNEVDFLKQGSMDVYALGASLMLDFTYYTPRYEIDIEWRISDLVLNTLGNTPSGVSGTAQAGASSLWARWRAPTGLTALDRPLRYVLEAAHTSFLGSQANIVEFDHLSSLGVGLELDSSAHDIYVTRTRLMLRYCFGENVSGASIGLALSF